jgi:hypothetical protein
MFIVANLLPKAARRLFRLYKFRPERAYVAKGTVSYAEVT